MYTVDLEDFVELDSEVESVVAGSCGLVDDCPEVSAVHVVAGRRPTYDELSRLRRVCDGRGVEMYVDGAGNFTLRRHIETQRRTASPSQISGTTARPAESMSLERGVSTALNRLSVFAAHWSPVFPGLAEGTR